MKLSKRIELQLSTLDPDFIQKANWAASARELEAQVSQLQGDLERKEAVRKAQIKANHFCNDQLRAQVSQLTEQRDEARAICRKYGHEPWDDVEDRCMWDAEPKWRADSARLGVTEAEAEKDLEAKP